MRQLPALALAALLFSPAVGAIEQQVDDLALAEAIRIARQSDAARGAFHGRYTAVVADPTYDRVEVISEYRRAVLLSEEQLKLGQLWDVSKAKAALAPYWGLVSFVLRIKFPPQNNLVQIPNYEMIVYPKGIPPPPAKPVILRFTTPRVTALYPAGGGNFPVGPRGGAMSGALIEGVLPASSLDLTGRCIVGLLLDGTEQRRATFELGSIR